MGPGPKPGYAPTQPRSLWLIAKCLGYENAEAVSEIARTVKRRLEGVDQNSQAYSLLDLYGVISTTGSD